MDSKKCNHPGYPFGEPPVLRCNLPAEHSGDHESEYNGKQYKHAEIMENRKSLGLYVPGNSEE